jgi:hypothetical protein
VAIGETEQTIIFFHSYKLVCRAQSIKRVRSALNSLQHFKGFLLHLLLSGE